MLELKASKNDEKNEDGTTREVKYVDMTAEELESRVIMKHTLERQKKIQKDAEDVIARGMLRHFTMDTS